jgi:hypothetical protein
MHNHTRKAVLHVSCGLVLAVFHSALTTRCHGAGDAAPTTDTRTSDKTIAVYPLPIGVETKGPFKAPPALNSREGLRVSGQGFWKFVAVTDGVLPIPEEARPLVKGAHATIVIDAPHDTVYWGLAKIGWLAFSNHLSQSWVVKGDPASASGNLHGADLLYRPGQLPLVAVADNEQGAVYLSDTTFQHVSRLDWPQSGPYTNKNQFHPTDVAFVNAHEMYVTDGYGAAYLMPVTIEPLAYAGGFLAGKATSQTPHGLTFDPRDKSLLISARPEAQIKRWSVAKKCVVDILGLPPGSTVCDLDVWGDYALAPCLDGPGQTPGPIYVVNLKKRMIVSTIRPKIDLGLAEAQHLHDAIWYFMPNGRQRQLYVLFTNWNPGGIAALKLVNVPD